MAQGKQTPRQKMINLMYLVFIAMMALNIDAEIIRSYYDSTESLKETRFLTQKRSEDIFEKTLEAKANQVPDTYAQPWSDYKNLKVLIDDLVGHTDNVAAKLKKDSEFFEKDSVTGEPIDIQENFASLNNQMATTQYFFTEGDETKPSDNAKELKKKMDNVRDYIVKTFGKDPHMKMLVDRANTSLITEFPNEKSAAAKTWFQKKFYNQPLIATISNLEIIANDARNIQSDALALMLQEKVDADVKFSNYEAIVSGPVDIQSGQQAEIKVMLGNYSNSNKINISGVSRQENGVGIIPISAAGEGKKELGGVITLTDASGKPQTYPWKHTYNVIAGPQQVKLQKGLLLSADKMNVMYRGLENPVSGSILGADNSKLSLSASGAAITPTGPGKWNVKPGAGKTVNLTLSGKDPSGKTVTQVFEYRIKNIPPPQGQIRGKNVLPMPAGSVANQTLDAVIPDFDFPVSFKVTSFNVRVPGRATMLVQGNSLEGAAGLFKNLRSGDGVYIFDIKATPIGLGNYTPGNISPVLINVQ